MFFAFLVILEMKLWKAVLFLLVMALAGCGGSHDARVTAELDRADSLLLTSDTAAHRAALNRMLALDALIANHTTRHSIEIEGSAENRQTMVDIVGKDNGKGGKSDANNREYGGYINESVVTEETPGPVSDPAINDKAEISIRYGSSTFHSHPSGDRFNPDGFSYFIQPPSPGDIEVAGNHTHYLFARRQNKVYIYNSN